MKINPKHNKEVNNAIHQLRMTLVKETIALMRQIGADTGDDVTFDNVLIMYQRDSGMMRTILCDRISFAYVKNGDKDYYIVSLDYGEKKYIESSLSLSLDNMKLIYDEVYKVVRRY